MKIAGRHATSLVDGKGVNYTLFVQGCQHGCEGCQNPSTWDMNGGKEMTLEEIKNDIQSFVPPVSGVTFSGGDPVYQLKDTLELARWAQTCGLRTTLYTGFSISEVFSKLAEEKCSVSDAPFDYIVDGCFIQSEKSTDFAFRGSANQNIYKKFDGLEYADYVRIEIDDDGAELTL